MKYINVILLILGISSCKPNTKIETIFSVAHDYDFFENYCKNKVTILEQLTYLNPCTSINRVTYPKRWGTQSVNTKNTQGIIFLDTISIVTENSLPKGSFQILEHEFEKTVDLKEFFEQTIKNLQDSQLVNKKYQVIDSGFITLRKKSAKSYWVSYERDDFYFDKASVVSYYYLGIEKKSIVQIDFIKYGLTVVEDIFCQYKEIKNSVIFRE